MVTYLYSPLTEAHIEPVNHNQNPPRLGTQIKFNMTNFSNSGLARRGQLNLSPSFIGKRSYNALSYSMNIYFISLTLFFYQEQKEI